MAELIELNVSDMSCEHCRRAITEALTALPTVANVSVDLETKQVVIEGVGLDEAAIRTAIVDAGYVAEP